MQHLQMKCPGVGWTSVPPQCPDPSLLKVPMQHFQITCPDPPSCWLWVTGEPVPGAACGPVLGQEGRAHPALPTELWALKGGTAPVKLHLPSPRPDTNRIDQKHLEKLPSPEQKAPLVEIGWESCGFSSVPLICCLMQGMDKSLSPEI